MESKRNPALYRELSKPFQGIDLADAALRSFADGLEQLRIKHKIQDVVCLCQVPVLDASGDEGVSMVSLSFGDPIEHLTMVARELGAKKARFDDGINRLVKAHR